MCYSGSGCFDQNNRVFEPARRFALSRGRFLVTTSWTTLDTIYRSVVSMICAIEQFAVTSVVAHRFQPDFHVLRRFYRRGTFVNHQRYRSVKFVFVIDSLMYAYVFIAANC